MRGDLNSFLDECLCDSRFIFNVASTRFLHGLVHPELIYPHDISEWNGGQ